MNRSARLLPAILLVLVAAFADGQNAQTGAAPPAESTAALPSWLDADPLPGSYRSDQALSLSVRGGGRLSYRLPETPSGRFITWSQPLLLTALPGEERTILVTVRLADTASPDGSRPATTPREVELRYRIDKRPPDPPLPSLRPGYYRTAQSLTFVPPTAGESGTVIHAWRDDDPAGAAAVWNGSPIELPQDQRSVTSRAVFAYTEDAAGNQSALQSFRYTVGPAEALEPSLEVVSPVSGNYANQQLLYLRSSGLREIRYSVDGTDPLKDGRIYSGPVLMDASGEVTLTVVGIPEMSTGSGPNAAPVLKRVVRFTQDGAGPLSISQGTVRAAVSVEPPADRPLRYVVGDGAAESSATAFDQPLQLSPTAGTVRTYVLRLFGASNGDGPSQARYTFVLDGRAVQTPTIRVDLSRARSGVPLVSIDHDPQAQLFFTTDGTQPDSGSTRYSAPFYPPAIAGGVTIRARAFLPSADLYSETAEKRVEVDSTVPDRPSVAWLTPENAGGAALFRVDTPRGSTVRFTIERSGADSTGVEAGGAGASAGRSDTSATGASAPVPDSTWGTLPSGRPLLLDAPRGAAERVTLTIVAESRFGVYSRPLSVERLLNDVPPREPQITASAAAQHADGNAAAGAADSRPVPQQTPLSVTLSGSGKLLVSISSTPADDTADTPGFTGYDSPITLAGRAGIRTTYTVRAAAVGVGGITSEMAEERYVVDLRSAELPAAPPPADPDLTRAERVRFTIRHDGRAGDGEKRGPEAGTKDVYLDLPQGVAVRYTLSHTADSPPPDVSSPFAPDVVMMPGTPGSVTEWDLQLLPVLDRDGTTIVGPVRVYRFLLDNEAPAPPVIRGIRENGVYAAPVAVSVDSLPRDTFAYLQIRRGREPVGPDAPGGPTSPENRYAVPIILDGEQSRSIEYTIVAATEDAAGNRSRLVTRHITIDRTGGGVPLVSYAGADGQGASKPLADGSVLLSPEPIKLSIAPPVGSPTAVRYALGRIAAGEASEPETMPSAAMLPAPEQPLLLTAEQGSIAEYTLVAESVLPDGASAGRFGARVVIDRRGAEAPEEPDIVSYTGVQGEQGYISWPLAGSQEIRYRVEPGSTGDFASYRAPVPWSAGSRNAGVSVSYFSVDAAGARTPQQTAQVAAPSDHPLPVLAGVEDGAVYSSGLTIRNETQPAAGGVVRFEMTDDGSSPPPVTRYSPELPASLPVIPVPGQDVRFQIHAKTFSTGGSSPVVRIAFNIDRKPPAPPEIAGASDGGYYQESRTVTLSVPRDNAAIFYRLTRNVDSEAAPASISSPAPARAGSFTRYSGPLTLEAVKGGLVAYTIDAYSEDAAGNRSPQVRTYHLYIDREVIYLRAGADDAKATGSRERPAGTLARAIEIARNSGRGTIFMSAGDYAIDAPLAVQNDLRLVGGLSPENWQEAGSADATSIHPGAGFPAFAGQPYVGGAAGSRPAASSRPLFRVTSGSLRLQRVHLSDGGKRIVSILLLEGGAVVADQSSFKVGSKSQVLIQTGGRAEFRRCDVERSTSGETAGDGSAYRLLVTEAGELAFSDSSADPGNGINVGAIRITGGSALIARSRIRSGTGLRYAAAVELAGGSLRISGGTIEGEPASDRSVALQADGAEAVIEGAEVVAAGSAGALGINSTGSRISIDRSRLRGGRSSDFSYLVNAVGGELVLTNSLLEAGRASDSAAIVGQDCTLAVVQNTIRAGRGSHTLAGIQLIGGSVTVANNIFAGEDVGPGNAAGNAAAKDVSSPVQQSTRDRAAAAILLSASPGGSESSWTGSLDCRSNAFAGWSNLLVELSGRAGRFYPPGRQPPAVATAAELNHTTISGARFADNRVVSSGDLFAADGAHLAAGGAAQGIGTNPTALSTPGLGSTLRSLFEKNVLHDIDGESRPGTNGSGWDVGADQLNATGASPSAPAQ